MFVISYSYVLAKSLIILWMGGIPAQVPLASKYWKGTDSLDSAIMKAAMATVSVTIPCTISVFTVVARVHNT